MSVDGATPAPRAHTLGVTADALGDLTHNSIAAIVGAAITLFCCSLFTLVYNRYPVLHCAFNKILYRLNLAQMCLALNVLWSSTVYLAGHMSPILCDVSASLNCFFACIAMLSNIGFFVAIAQLKRNAAFNVDGWCLVSVLVACVTLTATWVVLGVYSAEPATTRHLYFTFDVAWCDVPQKADGITSMSELGLGLLHLATCIVFIVGLLMSTVVSFVSLRFVDARASDWSRGKTVIYIRFWGSFAFSMLIFSIGGLTVLFGEQATGVLASFTYPSWGAYNAIIFLVTEKFTVHHLKPCGKVPDTIENGGFNQVISALACSWVVGQSHVPSAASIGGGNPDPNKVLQGIVSDRQYSDQRFKEEQYREQIRWFEDGDAEYHQGAVGSQRPHYKSGEYGAESLQSRGGGGGGGISPGRRSRQESGSVPQSLRSSIGYGGGGCSPSGKNKGSLHGSARPQGTSYGGDPHYDPHFHHQSRSPPTGTRDRTRTPPPPMMGSINHPATPKRHGSSKKGSKKDDEVAHLLDADSTRAF